ncbi:MAG: type 1 glutamine amidotransferase [Deltaproteobacteria bacterium]|nr:type 1 glutamine amidotransferase [Deltaproteobacteria bacterium]MBW1795388.1 type 1 glutamine amidotransferase [Deltaproteobacteria bacterium]
MTKQFLVIQHMPWEGPGTHLVRSVQKCGVLLHAVEVWHQPIPGLSSYDGLIVLGGGPNVDQEKEYPFLKAEKAVIRRAIEADMPYLGFCLGHQFLADALRARIGPNFRRSVGFTEGHLTKDGRKHAIFGGMPRSFPLFKWHGQAVLPPLPKEIQVLVTSAECEVEAISVEGRPHIVGLQFDNHAATSLDVAQWLESDEEWLSQPPGVDTAAVLKNAEKQEALIGKQFELMFTNYIKLIS